MAIVLGPNQYGKAENRVVRIYRDTQKQTVYAYAKEVGVGEIEEFALALGRHFVDDVEPVQGCRIEVEEYAWERILVDGREHDHSWTRKGSEVRTTIVTIDGKGGSQSVALVPG